MTDVVKAPGVLAILVLGAALLTGCAGASDAPSATPSTHPSQTLSPIVAPTPSPSPSPTFDWTSRPATVDDLGTSWRVGCPVGPEGLVVVDLTYRTFEGTVATGELIVNAGIEAQAHAAFHDLFDQHFPIRSIINVDAFNSSDDASMAADNTSAFNCRHVAGTDDWSNHAYGRAIDINPVENPYILDGDVQPPAAAAFVERVAGPGLLIDGGEALNAFLDAGFGWGGAWRNSKDYQHVEIPN